MTICCLYFCGSAALFSQGGRQAWLECGVNNAIIRADEGRQLVIVSQICEKIVSEVEIEYSG
jgi:hypothetical protein